MLLRSTSLERDTSDLAIARLSRQLCYLEALTTSQSCIAVKSQIVDAGVYSAVNLSGTLSTMGMIVMIDSGSVEAT